VSHRGPDATAGRPGPPCCTTGWHTRRCSCRRGPTPTAGCGWLAGIRQVVQRPH